MREFIARYPDWEKWGIQSARGWLADFKDISVDWFRSADTVAQLALQMTGSDIVREGTDPARRRYVEGSKTRKRQWNFVLYILQHSGNSGQRADTNEFLADFTEWVDLMDELGKTPIFGDLPSEETMWVTGGGFLADWDGDRAAGVYQVGIHKVCVRRYESENTWE